MALQRHSVDQIVNAVNNSGTPWKVYWNDGKTVIDDSYQPAGNTLIYNSPSSSVRFRSTSRSGGGQGWSALPAGASTSGSVIAYVGGRQDSSEYSNQHGLYVDIRSSHVATSSRHYCPIPGCAKGGVNIGSDARLMQHYLRNH